MQRVADITFTLDTAALERAVAGLASVELVKIGAAVATEAKRLAPVDTGRLRSSIYSEPDGPDVIVGASAEYAAYVEYGTRYQHAQPFMTPAIHAVAQRVAKRRAG